MYIRSIFILSLIITATTAKYIIFDRFFGAFLSRRNLARKTEIIIYFLSIVIDIFTTTFLPNLLFRSTYNMALYIIPRFLIQMAIIYMISREIFYLDNKKNLLVATILSILSEGSYIISSLILAYVDHVFFYAYPFILVSLYKNIVLETIFIFIISIIVLKLKRISHSYSQNKVTSIRLIYPISTIFLFILFETSGMMDTLDPHKSYFILMLYISLIASNIIFYMIFEHILKIQYENSILKMQELKSSMNEKYYKKISSDYQEKREIIHDTNNHLRAIASLAKNHEYERLELLVEDLCGKVESSFNAHYSSSSTVNALLYDKIHESWHEDRDNKIDNLDEEKINVSEDRCTDSRINFEIKIDKSIDFSFIADIDLITIFGNALDNAIEASKYTDIPFIKISAFETPMPSALFIEISNRFDQNRIHKDSDLLLSTKNDGSEHGFGISNIKKSAGKYNGIVNIDIEDDIFTLTIMFNL